MHNGTSREKKSGKFEHQLRHFKPGNLEEGSFAEIVLTVDELEAMRLSFLENLSLS